MADLLFTSDIHCQATPPVARTDDYLTALAMKLAFVDGVAEAEKVPIFDAGDFLSRWKVDPEMEQWCIDYVPLNFNTIIGNHDMKNHNIDLWKKGSLALLDKAGVINVLPDGHAYDMEGVRIHVWHYGTKEPQWDILKSGRNILITHQMVCNEKQHHEHFVYETSHALLKRFPKFDLIVSGHNHKSFMCKSGKRVLLNPGSLMRRDATQKKYHPRVFLWTAKDNSIKPVDVPHEPGAISDEHLKSQERHDEMIDAFVSGLEQIENKSLNFVNNLELYIAQNKITKPVEDKVWEFVS